MGQCAARVGSGGQADLQRLNQDQDRIRKNLRETPKEAEVYQTYLKKLSDQEKEIDTLTAKQKKLMADEFKTPQEVRGLPRQPHRLRDAPSESEA